MSDSFAVCVNRCPSAKVGCGMVFDEMKTFNRNSICRVFLVVSVLVLIGIGFIATPAPKRLPLFAVNAALTLPAIVFGSKWQRVAGCILLAIVLYLAEGEYSAGKVKQKAGEQPYILYSQTERVSS